LRERKEFREKGSGKDTDNTWSMPMTGTYLSYLSSQVAGSSLELGTRVRRDLLGATAGGVASGVGAEGGPGLAELVLGMAGVTFASPSGAA
jgi:hypothetical protein